MVRTILAAGIFVVLFCLAGSITPACPPPVAQTCESDDNWRRTVDGWEDRTDWHSGPQRSEPPLHPAVVGLAIALGSATGLLAMSGRER